jgi:hypothetical protein
MHIESRVMGAQGSTMSCRLKHGQDSMLRFMRRIGFVLTFVLFLGAISESQTVKLTLMSDLSSKLPTGTIFTAKDAEGKIYTGHLVTHPARRILRRGSMALVFDEPVVPITKDREGIFRAGNKMRFVKLGASLAAGKLADDLVDTSIGATKARYVAAGVGAALIILQKGGEAKLHQGDTIEVEPRSHTMEGQTTLP